MYGLRSDVLALKKVHFLSQSYALPPPAHRKAPRPRRTRQLREEGQRRQEDQVDGADEHQPCRPAHQRLHLEHPPLSDPASCSRGADKHHLRLRLVLLLVVLVPLRASPSLTRLLPPSLFPLSTAQRYQPHDQARNKENKQLFRTAAGSNGVLRVVGPGKAVAARSSSVTVGDEGEKQVDFAALKSTG